MERRASASRRIANVLLSVVLVLGLMPAPAFAEGAGGTDAIGSPTATGATALPMTIDDVVSANDGDSSEPSEIEATLTPGWTQSGTCEWKIDGAGLLTVRPLGDGASGELADWWNSDYYVPWYEQRASIKSAVIEPGVSAKTCYAMFWGCSSLASLDLSGLDTSKVTDMTAMFYGCSKLSSLDLSSFDTGSVTAMGYCYRSSSYGSSSSHIEPRGMFWGCSSLKVLDLSSFDTSKVKDMCGMFSYCTSLSSLDLLSLDTSNVTDMSYMFEGCSKLSSLDLSSLDTSAVTDMTAMFYGCSKLSSLDLSSFDTGSVTAMGYHEYYNHTTTTRGMFEGCSSLKVLDLSSFGASKVKDMGGMFRGCSSLSTIYASLGFGAPWDFPCMFEECSALVGGNGTAYSPDYTDGARAGVDGYNGPGYITLKEGLTSGWKLCGTCEWKIDDAGLLTVRPLGDGVSGELADWNGYDGAPWYSQRESIKSALIKPGVSAKTCFAMFYDCANLASADLSGLDFSTVKDMSKMFYGCASLKEIPAGFEMLLSVPASQCFYVPDSTEMRYTGTDAAITTYDWASDNRVLGPAAAEGWSRFGGVQWQVANGALTIAPLPGETGGEMGSLGIYAGAPWYAQRKDITSVKIEGDIKAGASLGYAFDGMANLVSADLSNLDVSATADMSCMFRGCSSLAAVDLFGWVTPSLENAYMAFSKCASLQSVNLIGWDFSRTTDMRQMFAYCPMLISVPLGLTIPDGVNASKLFYVESDEPISIRYGGDDGSIRGYDWASDNRTLSSGCAGEHSWDEGTVTKEPTCTEPGEKTLTCTACGATLVGSPVAPTGHAWGEPVIAFSEDGRSAVATWTCGNDAAHTETADCNVTSEVTKPATCTEAGETTYTATAASKGKPSGTAQKTLADMPAKGHEWLAPAIAFSEDGQSAYAIWACKNDASHMRAATCAVTSSVTPATCEDAETTTYTATVSADGMSSGTSSTTRATAPAKGHAWGEPVVEFSDNMESATATWTCANDASHKHVESCKVTKREKLAASCFAHGEDVCVATAAFAGAAPFVFEATAENTPAKGHRFDGMTCPDCGTHLGDVNGNGVVNVVDAQIAYDIAMGKGDYSNLPGYKAYRGAADVTGSNSTPDGIVDAVDAFRIQYAALHGWE